MRQVLQSATIITKCDSTGLPFDLNNYELNVVYTIEIFVFILVRGNSPFRIGSTSIGF